MQQTRRFLVDRLPGAAPDSETVLRQVFWRLGDGWVLRLRREGPAGLPPRDSLSVGGAGRPTRELPMPPGDDAVAGLWRAGAAHRVIAQRRHYRLAGQAWTVDEYVWENAGLRLAEAELTGPAPAWCGREVTADGRYEAENLAYEPFSGWGAPSR